MYKRTQYLFIHVYMKRNVGLTRFHTVVTQNPTHLASLQPQLNARFKCRGSFNVLLWLLPRAEETSATVNRSNK